MKKFLSISGWNPQVYQRELIVGDIKYPEHDALFNAESYLQDLIEGDLVGDDVGRWCVNVKEVLQ